MPSCILSLSPSFNHGHNFLALIRGGDLAKSNSKIDIQVPLSMNYRYLLREMKWSHSKWSLAHCGLSFLLIIWSISFSKGVKHFCVWSSVKIPPGSASWWWFLGAWRGCSSLFRGLLSEATASWVPTLRSKHSVLFISSVIVTLEVLSPLSHTWNTGLKALHLWYVPHPTTLQCQPSVLRV